MYTKEIFSKELGLIQNKEIRDFVNEVLDAVPEYFFSVAASSTGKYHPAYSLGEGGLVRHTKAAIRIAVEMLNLEQNSALLTGNGKDCIIAALMLHDSVKHGPNNSPYSVVEHPLYAADLIQNVMLEKENMSDDLLEAIHDIQWMIRSHMGQWNADKSGKEIMPKPKDEMEKFVHLCDYLASRRFLTCELENV